MDTSCYQKKKDFLISKQISFQCRKNEIFNVTKKEYFYVAKKLNTLMSQKLNILMRQQMIFTMSQKIYFYDAAKNDFFISKTINVLCCKNLNFPILGASYKTTNYCNLGQNIQRLLHFLAQFVITTSETELYYYHQKVNVLVASRVVEQLETQDLSKL